MCGFSGIAFVDTRSRDNFSGGLDAFRTASRRIAHRGDTEHREYLNEQLWLSHYRLAFQDTSGGKQPMISQDGRHVIVFNGEVYNHLQLRPQISRESGVTFKTRSDTETLLEGWKVLGNSLFELLEGEYAFIIMSLDGTELVAHRDKFGVKPLYLKPENINTDVFSEYRKRYDFTCRHIEFASEIKAITSKKTWHRDGLLRQFVGLFEPIRTPFQSIIQLPGGAVLEARSRGGEYHCSLTMDDSPVRKSVRGTGRATEEDFSAALRASVEERLLSDVELGIYLSGGIDSRAIAYEMSRLSDTSRKIKSFTVGFTEAGYDESASATDFAKYLGMDPHLLMLDDAALQYSYPLAVQSSELIQPFTNGCAKWWLGLFTRQSVQGVLTGDGADEMLCGYPSYRYVNWWKFAMRARKPVTNCEELKQALSKDPLGSHPRDSLYFQRFNRSGENPWLAGSSASGTGQDFIDSIEVLGVPHPLFGQISAITETLLGPSAARTWLKAQATSIQSWYLAGFERDEVALCDPNDSLLLWQNYFAKNHLPVLITNWVGDRMEMANTLEGRTPFLSSSVSDLVYKQPDHAL
ncbi:Asparagine synthetase [glutamine-hydrolyzing], partial [hydrothermal vent metagenome]